jgi:hypothetical protein
MTPIEASEPGGGGGGVVVVDVVIEEVLVVLLVVTIGSAYKGAARGLVAQPTMDWYGRSMYVNTVQNFVLMSLL